MRATQPRNGTNAAIVSALLAVALYAITLRGTYVYDDLYVLRQDPRLNDPGQWGRYLTEPYMPSIDLLYRPVTSISYAVQWWIHGDRPWAFHLVNVLLHAGVCALVALVAARLAGRWVAYAAGLLFAAHPVHVEAVANIVGRAELLCALGMMGALWLALLRPLTWLRAGGIIGFFLLSLFSKEQGMLVPFILAAAWWARKWEDPVPLGPAEKRRMQWVVIGLCWMLAGYIVARENYPPLRFSWDRFFLDWTINPMVRARGPDRLWVPVEIAGRYALLLLFPARLMPDYGVPITGWTAHWNQWPIYAGMASLALGMAGLAIAFWKRSTVAAICLIGMALTYGMVSNLPTLIGTIMGERLMYLPSAFGMILLGWALMGRHVRRRIGAGPILVSILLVLGCVRSFTYARLWNDPIRLYQSTIAEEPRSLRVRIILAEELRRRGQLRQAAEVLAEAREVLPEYYLTWLRSAQVAMDRGRLDEAEHYLDHADRMEKERMTRGLTEASPLLLLAPAQSELARLKAATQPAGKAK
ncbi:MAG: hypothetical protein IT446_01170 [Phycisphaerales bacterium]|nr:hypothetical protein [Phycisphaerales bacterium]